MKLPFTTQQFLEIFRKYNEAVYPLQYLFVGIAVLVIILVLQKTRSNLKVVVFALAAFWLWMGAVYHIGFFADINQAAYGFGVLFMIEGLVLLYFGVAGSNAFAIQKNVYGLAGSLLLLYALVVYPLIGYLAGRVYPYIPTFGLPCPTTIFTFGILLFSRFRLPLSIILIPLIWSVIGFNAAFTLGIYEDTALIVSGLVFVVLNRLKVKKSLLAATSHKQAGVGYNPMS